MTRRERDSPRRDDAPAPVSIIQSCLENLREEKHKKKERQKTAKKKEEEGEKRKEQKVSITRARSLLARSLARSLARLYEDLRLTVCNLIEDTLPEFLRELPVLFAHLAERELTLCLGISQAKRNKKVAYEKRKTKTKRRSEERDEDLWKRRQVARDS